MDKLITNALANNISLQITVVVIGIIIFMICYQHFKIFLWTKQKIKALLRSRNLNTALEKLDTEMVAGASVLMLSDGLFPPTEDALELMTSSGLENSSLGLGAIGVDISDGFSLSESIGVTGLITFALSSAKNIGKKNDGVLSTGEMVGHTVLETGTTAVGVGTGVKVGGAIATGIVTVASAPLSIPIIAIGSIFGGWFGGKLAKKTSNGIKTKIYRGDFDKARNKYQKKVHKFNTNIDFLRRKTLKNYASIVKEVRKDHNEKIKNLNLAIKKEAPNLFLRHVWPSRKVNELRQRRHIAQRLFKMKTLPWLKTLKNDLSKDSFLKKGLYLISRCKELHFCNSDLEKCYDQVINSYNEATKLRLRVEREREKFQAKVG